MLRRLSWRLGFASALVFATAQRHGVHAADAPQIQVSAAGVSISVESSTVFDTLDALGRAAGFKVSYEGGKPSRPLYKARIEAKTPAQAVLRLLDGQNLNFGVIYEAKGRKLSRVVIMGAPSASASTTSASTAPAQTTNPNSFLPPPQPGPENPDMDEEAEEAKAAEAEQASKTGTPNPPVPPPSPFGRQLGQPIGAPPYQPPRPPFQQPPQPGATPVPTPHS